MKQLGAGFASQNVRKKEKNHSQLGYTGKKESGGLVSDKDCLAWCVAAQRLSSFSMTSPALLLSSPPTKLRAVSTKSPPSLYPTKSPFYRAKFLHVHLPVSDLLWVFCLPAGFLAGSAFWEKKQNFRGDRRNGRTWSIFHCLGNQDSGLSPLGYTKGEIKGVVDMVNVESEEGSSSHAEL